MRTAKAAQPRTVGPDRDEEQGAERAEARDAVDRAARRWCVSLVPHHIENAARVVGGMRYLIALIAYSVPITCKIQTDAPCGSGRRRGPTERASRGPRICTPRAPGSKSWRA
jgi:hypothetical protein